MWFLLAQEHGGGAIDPTHPELPENLKAAAWSWAIFLVLLFVLWKFAWGPIAKGLDARAQRISDSLQRAEEVEKAAREIAETNRQLLAKAQQEAQGIVADARTSARHAADDLLKKASAEIDAQRERFTRETELVVDKARADLRRETVDLAIETAGKLLGRGMNDADHRRLAEQALRDADSVTRN